MIEGYNKKNGELLQPNSFGTKSKILFAIFKKRDVNYSLTEDFKFLGGFGSYSIPLLYGGTKMAAFLLTAVVQEMGVYQTI